MNRQDRISKKAYLDYLFYKVGNQSFDFYLQYSEKDGVMTTWRKYSEAILPLDFDGSHDNSKMTWFLEKCNHRQIFPNEIVFDFESQEEYDNAKDKLEDKGWNYRVYSTNSRGYHVHVFFDKNIREEDKLEILDEFGADMQKAGDKCLIALENAPHWKSGNKKELVKWK